MYLLIYPDYFTKILEDDLKAITKPQYVDQIPKAIRGPDRTVGALIEGRASMENMEEVLKILGTLPRGYLQVFLLTRDRIESHFGP